MTKPEIKTIIDSWTINCQTCNTQHTIGNKRCKKFVCNICDAHVPFYKFMDHLEKECGSQKNGIIRTCKRCKEKVFKEHLDSRHPLECPKRKTTCTYCRNIITYDKLNEHQYTCRAQSYSRCEICKGVFLGTVIDLHQIKCKPKTLKDKKNHPRSRESTPNENKRLDKIRERLRKKLDNGKIIEEKINTHHKFA